MHGCRRGVERASSVVYLGDYVPGFTCEQHSNHAVGIWWIGMIDDVRYSLGEDKFQPKCTARGQFIFTRHHLQPFTQLGHSSRSIGEYNFRCCLTEELVRTGHGRLRLLHQPKAEGAWSKSSQAEAKSS